MIAYIEGRYLEQTETSVIVLTEGGVGYEIFAPSHALAQLPARGEVVIFYTVHVVREDAAELFGFPTWDERQTFLILTSINRVGARTAISILSTFSPNELRQMVLDNNSLALTQVSGIGKKSAQQIYLDLQYKLQGSASAGLDLPTTEANQVLTDTIAALVNLGYQEEEVRPVIKEILNANPDYDVTASIRACLKQLAQNKQG